MPRLKQKLQPLQQSNDRRISTEWFHGLDQADHEEFERIWRNSTYVLDQMKRILQRRLAELETDREDDYNNPQWPVLRADRNGQLRQLKKMIALLP